MGQPGSPEPFAPLQLSPGISLPPAWLAWLRDVLSSGDDSLPPLLPTDWAESLPAIAAHRLGPLLYTRIRDRAIPVAAGLLAALAEDFRANAVRTFRMEAELERVLAGLAAADVPCLLLKGLALGRLVYPSPAERPVSDLDLLVPRERLAQAAAVLTDLGFRLHGPSPLGPIGRSFYRYRAELPAVGVQARNRGLLAELHWSLAELPYYMDRIDMAEVWENARPLDERRTLVGDDTDAHRTLARDPLPGQAPTSGSTPGSSAQVPDPAVLLLHACAHLALHHSRDLRLIWLVDLDRLARSGLDWERAVALAERWRLGHAAMTCLSVARRWLGTPLPSAVLDALAVLAEDPVGRAMWGLGDETLPGRWWRRAWATWAAFDVRQRVRYAGWLALRVLLRPSEWLGRR